MGCLNHGMSESQVSQHDESWMLKKPITHPVNVLGRQKMIEMGHSGTAPSNCNILIHINLPYPRECPFTLEFYCFARASSQTKLTSGHQR